MTLGPIKILFVESDTGEQLSMERFLRAFGATYRLHAVNSTQGALKCLAEAHYDVVLVDYRFSDGTVFDLLDQSKDVPVIFLTEEGHEATVAMALKRGAYDYLIKDAAGNYLKLLPGTIQKVLNRRRAELALHQYELRCRDLMDLIMDIYLCISEEGSILLVNRAGASQLGYEAREMLGMPLERVVHPDDVGILKRDMIKASGRPDQVCESRFRLKGRNGRILSVKSEIRMQPEKGKLIPVVRLMCRVLAVVNGALAPKGQVRRTRGTSSSGPSYTLNHLASAASMEPSERVLVVDGNREQRALAARILAKLGYRVVTAESGQAAMALMKAGAREDTPNRSPFGLVLLDVTMADGAGDGLDTFRNIVRDFPQQRCVILSAAVDDERVAEARRLGAGAMIQKPYTVEELAEAVRQELERS